MADLKQNLSDLEGGETELELKLELVLNIPVIRWLWGASNWPGLARVGQAKVALRLNLFCSETNQALRGSGPPVIHGAPRLILGALWEVPKGSRQVRGKGDPGIGASGWPALARLVRFGQPCLGQPCLGQPCSGQRRPGQPWPGHLVLACTALISHGQP